MGLSIRLATIDVQINNFTKKPPRFWKPRRFVSKYFSENLYVVPRSEEIADLAGRIKDGHFALPNFTLSQVRELFGQYTKEVGQAFAPDVINPL